MYPDQQSNMKFIAITKLANELSDQTILLKYLQYKQHRNILTLHHTALEGESAL